LIAGAVLLVVALVGAGWAMLSSDPATGNVAATAPDVAATSDDASTLPSATPTASPSAKPTKSVKPSPKTSPTKKATVRPTPSAKPPKKDLPPAPPSTSTATTGPNCPKHTGTDASKTAVRDALVAAGARQYWNDSNRPGDLDGDLPTITIPANLMKAVAWQESGWQSTILACDGGIGTMQVMPGTATWANGRFGTSYDVNTLSGNTALGAEYLQWEIMYFGLYYFGDFDLDATAAVGPGGAEMTLRDVVIAGYNVGAGAVENRGADGADDYLEIPNQRYVDNVTALITECTCLSY
jgi:hypothetical protein